MQTAVYVKKKSRIEVNNEGKNIWKHCQPILKVRTVQLPMFFIFTITAKKLAPWIALKSSTSLYWCTC